MQMAPSISTSLPDPCRWPPLSLPLYLTHADGPLYLYLSTSLPGRLHADGPLYLYLSTWPSPCRSHLHSLPLYVAVSMQMPPLSLPLYLTHADGPLWAL